MPAILSKSSVFSSSMTSTMLLTPIAPTSRPSSSVTGSDIRSYLRTSFAACCWSSATLTDITFASISDSTGASSFANSSVFRSSAPIRRSSASVT